MSTYGIEFAARGPDGRPRFWWYTGSPVAGTPKVTAVEAHVDALQHGHQHGGPARDCLLGADLWGSYLYACGVLRITPDPTIGTERMRHAIESAANMAVSETRRAA